MATYQPIPMSNTSGWALPGLEVKPGQFNAKNVPFNVPGAGAMNAGITPQNVYSKFAEWKGQAGQKDGGMAQLWKNLSRYADAKKSALLPNEIASYKSAVASGDFSQVHPDLLMKASDWALREAGRSQQHKKGFFDSVLGKLLGIPITAAGYALGGPLGAGAAAGIYGGVSSGSPLAGLLSAAGGYFGTGGTLGQLGQTAGKAIGLSSSAGGTAASAADPIANLWSPAVQAGQAAAPSITNALSTLPVGDLMKLGKTGMTAWQLLNPQHQEQMARQQAQPVGQQARMAGYSPPALAPAIGLPNYFQFNQNPWGNA